MKNDTFSSLRIFLFLFGLLVLVPGFAQEYASGPQVLSFHSDIDDREQAYGLYLPENYDPAKEYPFVVMLHGAGSNHRLGLRRVFGKSNAEGENDVEASLYFPKWEPRDFIVAAPFARGTMGYQGVAEKDVMDMVADVKRRFSIDKNRMYLTGLSMGGGGTLWLGLSYPDIWAAIAPVCPSTPDGIEPFAANALNVPVHIFQGGADQVVRPEGVREWVERFKKAGVDVKYKEYPGVGHDSWVNAYADEQVFDWFEQFERNPFPDQVKFSTDCYEYNKAYWVTLESFTPGTFTSIDAQFKSKNHLIVESKNVDAFSLKLKGHPKFDKKGLFKIEIDGKFFSASGTGNMEFFRSGGKWKVGLNKPTVLRKQKGLEGPMREVVSSRHIYVYGTGGSPTKEELERRQAQALKAADWSFYRGEFMGRIMVFPRVLSDQQVRPSDFESSNLILFGDENTNEVIAKFQDQLPMKLTGNTTDYGLAYIFPVGKRYVFVNSGISIFDIPKSELVRDWRNLPPVVNILRSFEDYVVFNKEKALSKGRFDHTWQLTEAARKLIQTTGAVTFP